MDGEQRRILVDEDARRHDWIGHYDFEDVALGRAEPCGVFERSIHIVVAADTPERMPVVVVDRGFVSQAPVGGVGIEVDVEVPWVVVQVAQHRLLGGGFVHT